VAAVTNLGTRAHYDTERIYRRYHIMVGGAARLEGLDLSLHEIEARLNSVPC